MSINYLLNLIGDVLPSNFIMNMREEFAKATVVTATELYAASENPTFEGQTPADDNGNYTMFWSIDGQHYKTNNNLFR